jgi:hypothetical protein
MSEFVLGSLRMDFRCASEILSGWSNVPRQKGAVRYPTFRMLTFCSHHEGLTGIEKDRKGLTGIENVGVLGKDLVFISWCVALSRRRQGFKSPWGRQSISKG